MNEDSRLLDLYRSFDDVTIIDKNGYSYFVHPLSDGIPSIDPGMLENLSGLVCDLIGNIDRVDLLLTAESMGIPITSAVSLGLRIPFSIARKRRYGMQGEVEVLQRTGYSSSDLFLNLPTTAGNLVIIDDVLSTGGTLRSLVKGVRSTGINIAGAVILFNKMGDGMDLLSEELGFPIFSVLDVEVKNQECIVSKRPTVV